MKKLTCEMCGSTNLIKKNGLFECQDCGTKYSVEEAKKMMADGTAAVMGTVPIERTNEIENRMTNAINEYRSGSKDVAYSLFSDILNIDPNNERAILYKALCGGWKSSIANPKLMDVSTEICRAVDINHGKTNPSISFSDFSSEVLRETMIIGKAMISTLVDYKTKQEQRVDEYMREAKSKSDESERNKWSNNYLAQSLIQSALRYANMAKELHTKVLNTYSEGMLVTLIPLETVGEHIVKQAPEMRYISSGLIEAMEQYIAAFETYFNLNPNKNQLNTMRDFCRDVRHQVWEREAQEKADRIQKYWETHFEEKQRLDSELVEINNEIEAQKKCLIEIEGENGSIIKDLENEKRHGVVPAREKQSKVDDELRDLMRERATLGMFKGKRKKELSALISSKEAELDEIRREAVTQEEELKTRIFDQIRDIKEKAEPYRNKIQELQGRKEAIETELSMDRPADGADYH